MKLDRMQTIVGSLVLMLLLGKPLIVAINHPIADISFKMFNVIVCLVAIYHFFQTIIAWKNHVPHGTGEEK